MISLASAAVGRHCRHRQTPFVNNHQASAFSSASSFTRASTTTIVFLSVAFSSLLLLSYLYSWPFLMSSASKSPLPVSSSAKTPDGSSSSNKNDEIGGFSFEIEGKVQGVFFRKYTQRKAEELNLYGWVRNHKGRGTVQGEVVSESKLARQRMQVWLQHEGSPSSHITKAHFHPIFDSQHVQDLLESGTFEVRKTAR